LAAFQTEHRTGDEVVREKIEEIDLQIEELQQLKEHYLELLRKGRVS
jgi:hypothetical protein